MAKPRSTFTSRAKETLKAESQRLGQLQSAAQDRGDIVAAVRYDNRREKVERSLDKIYAREQRPKKKKKRGGGSSGGS